MSKIKVLFCSSTFQHVNHGPAKFAQLLLKLNDTQSDIELKILTEDIEEENDTVFKIDIFWAKLFKPFSMLFRMIDYYQKAKKVRKLYPFSIIIFNHALVGLWSRLFFGNEVKVIGMINDENSMSLSWKDFKLSKYWIRYYIFKVFERWTAKSHDAIIANSKYIQKKISETYYISQEKIFLLYKSIQLQNVPLLNTKIINQEKKIDVLFVKSDPVVGGLVYLYEALNLLSEYQFKLIIVGAPSGFLEEKSETNVEIEYKGLISQKEVFEIMTTEADILSIPSLKEGLGVANMEGLLHSLPVVSTNVGGIPEVLDNGRNGWMAVPADIESLSIQLESCIKKKEEREIKVRNGYNYVLNTFNHVIMLDNFLKIIFSISKK